MLIDSHCHLEYEGLVEDQPGVLERARDAGVTGMLNISTRQSEWDRVVGTAAREADVWASVGIHPHEADNHADLGEAALLAATEHPKVIGIGETGLDYYYDKSDRQVQQAGAHHGSTYFEHLAFLEAIRGGGKPLVSVEDGALAVAVGAAAEKSIRERKPVELTELGF